MEEKEEEKSTFDSIKEALPSLPDVPNPFRGKKEEITIVPESIPGPVYGGY
ncbi:hypothetical protein L3V86_07960 [Thiotrichales bacterium 19S11-10]|nr:hypothetical protein [Thiotrichales bacterium 19S11-10]